MSWLELMVELIPLIFCVAVIMPLLIWGYINAEMIVEWMMSL